MDLEDLVLQGREVRVDAVVEVADVVLPAEFELETGVEHLTGVDGGAGHTDFRQRGDGDQQVVGVLAIPVGREGQAVVEEAGVDTGVILLGGLPLQARVREAGRHGTVGRSTVAGGRVVLVPLSVHGDGGGVAVAAQDVDITVDTPGSAEFQEGDGVAADIVAEERLVADGPAGGHGGEVTPAGLLGQLGGVVGVGTEVGLHAVAVVEGVHQTAEVGQLGAHARGVAHVLGGIGGQVVDVEEVGLIAPEDVRTVGGDARVVVVLLGVGHTDHRADVVLAERAVVVGEVLPLVVVARVDVRGDVVVRGLSHGGQPVRLGVAVAAVLIDTVAEAGGDHQALDGGEVGSQGAADVDAAAGIVSLVALEERVTRRFLQVLGRAVEVVVVGRISRDQIRRGSIVLLHAARGVPDVGDVRRGQRVDGDHGVQHGAVAVAEGLAVPLLDGVVGGDVEPLEELVIGVDLCGQTLIDILLAHEDTVVVEVVEGGEEVALVVAALEGDAVLLAPAGLERRLVPVVVNAVVAVGIQQVLIEVADVGLVVDVFLGAEDLGLLAEGLQGEAAVVGHGRVSFLAGLGGDEDDAVTCLRTVDGGGGGILEDLHGLDHGRIEVLDVVHLQAVHDEERSDVAGVGGVTADTDISTGTRSTGGVDDLDTGGLALEGGGGIRRGTVLQVVRTYGSHGAGQVTLPLHAVTDDHGLFQHLGILLEDDVVGGLVGDREGLGLVTDALHVHGGPGGDGQGESTVDVGGCTDTRVADNSDGCADDRLAAGINDSTTDGAVLGES